LIGFLISGLLIPVRSQLFDDSDVKDHQGVLDHFRSRIKQARHLIQATVLWGASALAFLFWGGVYEHVRGDLYNYNPNTTVLFNYVMSDTIAAQNMIKTIGGGSVAALLWHLVSSLGAPIPFPEGDSPPPKFPDIIRKPRAAEPENSASEDTTKRRRKRSLLYEEPYDDYYEDVFIIACNELFQPNGILRVFIINTLLLTAQFVFWGFCWVVLPPLP